MKHWFASDGHTKHERSGDEKGDGSQSQRCLGASSSSSWLVVEKKRHHGQPAKPSFPCGDTAATHGNALRAQMTEHTQISLMILRFEALSFLQILLQSVPVDWRLVGIKDQLSLVGFGGKRKPPKKELCESFNHQHLSVY